MDTTISIGQLLGIVGIIAIAYIAIYLVRLLKNATQTLQKVNKLLDDNGDNVTNIVKNADSVVSDAQETVSGLKHDIVEPVQQGVEKFTSVISRINKLGESQVARREKKLQKATRRAEKKAKKAA